MEADRRVLPWEVQWHAASALLHQAQGQNDAMDRGKRKSSPFRGLILLNPAFTVLTRTVCTIGSKTSNSSARLREGKMENSV